MSSQGKSSVNSSRVQPVIGTITTVNKCQVVGLG